MLINMNKRPTIQTVAERAGVSRGTVDRVLNNRSYVRADVRERVLDAIRETGYLSPREAHRQTADRPQNYSPVKLGVLLPNWAGPFREEVTRGIESARVKLSGRHAEIRVCTCETDIPGEAITLLDELVDWGAQGIALCALNDITIEAKVGELADSGIPCITFNSELLTKCIAPDAHVLALAGNLEYHGHRTRLDGFCSHMREKGFSSSQIDIGETYNDYRVTYNRVAAALKSATPPDAIYMANRSVTACIDAFRAAGCTGRVRVIAHDMSPGRAQMLREGTLDLTITQDMFRQGSQPLILLCDLLQLGTQPGRDQLATSISIICAQNID